jgi:FMN-dependent NADH-azoreductase
VNAILAIFFRSMRLLNIESSPRGSRSASIAVTSAFLEAFRHVCPGVAVDTLNVWQEKLPDFDQEAIGAKYKGINKEPMDSAEAAVWDKIQELARRFQRADRIVLGVPMWNFATRTSSSN